MVALPHLPAGVPHVVDALLDALAVEVKHKKEDEAYEAQDDPQEDVRGLQSEVCPRIPLLASQSQLAHGEHGSVPHAGREAAHEAVGVSDAVLRSVEPQSEGFDSAGARERVFPQQKIGIGQGVQLSQALLGERLEGVERQVQLLQLLQTREGGVMDGHQGVVGELEPPQACQMGEDAWR